VGSNERVKSQLSQALIRGARPDSNNIYIDDNIQIDITFLLIGVTLFEREKKNKKNTLYFPYKLILKRFAYFLYFLYSSFKARFFFIKLI
jgi:hypothetical protein